jgi:hypothetical protein
MKIIYLGPLRVGSSESPPLNVSAPVNVPLNKIDNDVESGPLCQDHFLAAISFGAAGLI